MDTQTLARELLEFSHTLLEARVDGCPPGEHFRVVEGSPVGSVASIYAHAVLGEDHFIATRLGEPPLQAAPTWRERFSFAPQLYLSPEWTAALRYDLDAFRAYAAEVYERSDHFLATLADAEAKHPMPNTGVRREGGEVTYHQREMPMLYGLMDEVTLHIGEHTGEIAAITGLLNHLPR